MLNAQNRGVFSLMKSQTASLLRVGLPFFHNIGMSSRSHMMNRPAAGQASLKHY